MERSKVIEHLQQLKCDYTNYWEETHDEMTDALDNAIADIKKLEEIELIATDEYGYLSSYSKLKDIKEVIYGTK